MAQQQLRGKTIALISSSGAEDMKLRELKQSLEESGIHTVMVSYKPHIHEWSPPSLANLISGEIALDQVIPEEFDGLVLPVVRFNHHQIQLDEEVAIVVDTFLQLHKPVAALCDDEWVMVESERTDLNQLWPPSIEPTLRLSGVN